MSLRNRLLGSFFSRRMKAIERFRRHPHEVQDEVLRYLLRRGAETGLGYRSGLCAVRSYEAFVRTLGVSEYDDCRLWIERMRDGERDVAWPGRVTRFARSSGTTSERSKYIPVTDEALRRNHLQGMRDVAALFGAAHPQSRVFEGKTLTLGGSCARERGGWVGDLSALLIRGSAFWNGWFRTPRIGTAVTADFDRKTERICRECVGQRVTSFAGVPSWNLALMRRVLEYTGRRNLLEVWPQLGLFVHGGVEFAPYRQAFERLIPSSEMCYMETYNASEGFFAIADDPARDDMLLMLDYGAFYEFRRGDAVVPLEGVRCGETYALIVTSCNGLWRYEIGDTVTFTATDPYRIRFAGRTRQYINVFGEELMAANAARALAEACRLTGAAVEEYTVAPCYMSLDRRGAHEWIVEFAVPPADAERFAGLLDAAVREANSDYDAKRRTTLDRLRLTAVGRGTFLRWLRACGRNKVPRLVNDRRVADELHAMLGANAGAACGRRRTEY